MRYQTKRQAEGKEPPSWGSGGPSLAAVKVSPGGGVGTAVYADYAEREKGFYRKGHKELRGLRSWFHRPGRRGEEVEIPKDQVSGRTRHLAQTHDWGIEHQEHVRRKDSFVSQLGGGAYAEEVHHEEYREQEEPTGDAVVVGVGLILWLGLVVHEESVAQKSDRTNERRKEKHGVSV
jgi:hypothetical protein